MNFFSELKYHITVYLFQPSQPLCKSEITFSYIKSSEPIYQLNTNERAQNNQSTTASRLASAELPELQAVRAQNSQRHRKLHLQKLLDAKAKELQGYTTNWSAKASPDH